MISALISFLVAVMVLFIFMKIIEIALKMFAAPAEAYMILKLICLLILLLYCVDLLGNGTYLGFPRLRGVN